METKHMFVDTDSIFFKIAYKAKSQAQLRRSYNAFCRNMELEIKNKIIEKSGFSEVFDDNNTLDGSNYSDYNQIKDYVHSKLRY